MKPAASIQSRLIFCLTLVLLGSLAIGSMLSYQHVIGKVRTEMQAAMAVGIHTANNAVDDAEENVQPIRRLRLVVGDFDGDRHMRASLWAPDGRLVAQSELRPPEDPAPDWFYRLVTTMQPLRAELTLPDAYRSVGRITLDADPHNEVSEAWSDLCLTLFILSAFFSVLLALIFWTMRSAFLPLTDVCGALCGVGAGDYSQRLPPMVYRELEPLRVGFNAMADRLQDISDQNRALHEQILNLQEEERAELARDLHDEVAPFLFSVGADAAMIHQFIVDDSVDKIAPRADAIAEAVRHMQKHLRDVLRRLAPGVLLDLGLAGAINNLLAFWKARRPEIHYRVGVVETDINPALDAVAFRVVQESLSNAMRHGQPSTIDVSVKLEAQSVVIKVQDDGIGFVAGHVQDGFGLAGMKQRVRAVDGAIRVLNRSDRHGVMVEAKLPLPPSLGQDVRLEERAIA